MKFPKAHVLLILVLRGSQNVRIPDKTDSNSNKTESRAASVLLVLEPDL